MHSSIYVRFVCQEPRFIFVFFLAYCTASSYKAIFHSVLPNGAINRSEKSPGERGHQYPVQGGKKPQAFEEDRKGFRKIATHKSCPGCVRFKLALLLFAWNE